MIPSFVSLLGQIVKMTLPSVERFQTRDGLSYCFRNSFFNYRGILLNSSQIPRKKKLRRNSKFAKE